jgi:ribosomal protein S24E
MGFKAHTISMRDSMDITRISEKENPLLKYKELKFSVNHLYSKTPTIQNIRKELAKEYEVKEEHVYVLSLKTLARTNKTLGVAEIYKSKEQAKQILPKHILKRNEERDTPK